MADKHLEQAHKPEADAHEGLGAKLLHETMDAVKQAQKGAHDFVQNHPKIEKVIDFITEPDIYDNKYKDWKKHPISMSPS